MKIRVGKSFEPEVFSDELRVLGDTGVQWNARIHSESRHTDAMKGYLHSKGGPRNHLVFFVETAFRGIFPVCALLVRLAVREARWSDHRRLTPTQAAVRVS